MTARALRSQIVFARRSVLSTVRQLADVEWGLAASLLRVSAEIGHFRAEAASAFLEELIEEATPL